MIREVSSRIRLGPYADAHTNEISVSHVLYDVLQAIVSSRASLLPKAQLSGLQINIIRNDNQMCGRVHLEIIQSFPNGFPGQVHIGHRLHDNHPGISDSALSDQRLPEPRRSVDMKFINQKICCFKADIVPASVIFFARVSQAYNQIPVCIHFHFSHCSCFICFHSSPASIRKSCSGKSAGADEVYHKTRFFTPHAKNKAAGESCCLVLSAALLFSFMPVRFPVPGIPCTSEEWCPLPAFACPH